MNWCHSLGHKTSNNETPNNMKSQEEMQEIKLSNGTTVLKSNYVKLKTKDLIEFGYTSLTEKEVEEQVEKILANDGDLSVIGLFCKDDLIVE
jgi:hypothetical protein